MRIIHDLDEMTETARGWLAGGAVGFVPTTGSLHAGHLSLVRAAIQECEFSVVSILARPVQIGQGPLLTPPPVDVARDIQVLQQEQVDVLFLPRVEALFPPSFATSVVPAGPVATQFEGTLNPAGLRHEATTIVKLFHLVRPDVLYLGQKNAQHLALVRQLLRDLNIDIKLRVMPVIREPDGLPVSNQNYLLSPQERQEAVQLHRALLAARQALEQGERRTAEIEKIMREVASLGPSLQLDYVAVCDPESFALPGPLLPDPPLNLLLIIAARMGGARLTDNLLLSDGLWLE